MSISNGGFSFVKISLKSVWSSSRHLRFWFSIIFSSFLSKLVTFLWSCLLETCKVFTHSLFTFQNIWNPPDHFRVRAGQNKNQNGAQYFQATYQRYQKALSGLQARFASNFLDAIRFACVHFAKTVRVALHGKGLFERKTGVGGNRKFWKQGFQLSLSLGAPSSEFQNLTELGFPG